MARWLFSPADVTLTVDGEALPTEAYRLLVASTVPDVGMGFRVPWQAGREPGRFHLVASGPVDDGDGAAAAARLPRPAAVGRAAPRSPGDARPHPLRVAADLHARRRPVRATDVELVTGPRLSIARV